MKKGFTLIELLAVIVILAIIALIATPIVLNIINDAKESAVIRSAEFYLRGLEQSLLLSRLNNIKVQDDVYSIMQDGNICIGEFKDNTCAGDILKVEMGGEVPTEGTVKIKNGEIQNMNITLSNKEIWTDPFTGKLEYKLAPGVYDENDKLILSWKQLDEKVKEELKEIPENIESAFAYLIEMSTYDNPYTGNVIKSVSCATKLVISDSVTSIGEYAFGNCNNLTTIYYKGPATSENNWGAPESTEVVR